jgi:flagellar protein FlgJ
MAGTGAPVAAAAGNIRPDQLKQNQLKPDQLKEDEKLRKACASFESFMIYYMLKTMRKSVPKGGLLGNMPGKETYEMMLDQKIAETAAERKGGGLGLQKVLYDQLSAGSRRGYGSAQGVPGPASTAGISVKN